MPTRPRLSWLIFVGIGLAAGVLSGLFGVGGGILIVPALLAFAGFDQRIAAGTSLAAIIPMSLSGVTGYALSGNVDVFAALLLVVGSVGGAQLGSLLLSRLPKRVLQVSFIVFIGVVIVSLFLVIPSRDASIEMTPLLGICLVLLGLVTGILSGILGIGGGIIVVPALIMLFGSSDLVAKGTSLLMMVPTAISGTIGNSIRRTVDLPAALIIGVSAALTTQFGVIWAQALSPRAASIVFAVFLVGIAVFQIRKFRRG
ncbi:MAG: sulfite exporter TauE/SafE family protein [Mycetocola sp.]